MANDFGTLLRKLRQEAGVSLGHLARQLEVSTPYMSDVERSNRAPLTRDRIGEVARVLSLDPARHEALLGAAAKSRGFFELAAKEVTPAKEELGAALARGWADLDDSRAERMREILEGGSD